MLKRFWEFLGGLEGVGEVGDPTGRLDHDVLVLAGCPHDSRWRANLRRT
jgi:hypothetical protein